MIFQLEKENWEDGCLVKICRHPKNHIHFFKSKGLVSDIFAMRIPPKMNPLGVTHEDSATNALQKSVAAMKPAANW